MARSGGLRQELERVGDHPEESRYADQTRSVTPEMKKTGWIAVRGEAAEARHVPVPKGQQHPHGQPEQAVLPGEGPGRLAEDRYGDHQERAVARAHPDEPHEATGERLPPAV